MPIPIQDGRDIEKHQNGLGIGNPGDPSYTIDTTGAQSAAIPYRKSKRASSETDDETWVEADKSNTLNNFDLGDTRTTHAVVHCSDVAPTVTSSGPPFSRTGNERVEAEALVVQTQPVAFQPGNLMRRAGSDPSTEVFPTVKCDTGDQSPHVAYPVVPLDDMNLLSRLGACGEGHSIQNFTPGDPMFTLKKGGSAHGVLTPMAVRLLTPEECEALQGFPKGYSRIPWKGKPESECPDGPRYKACGNSMAVPVMRWVGERIAEVEKLLSEQPKP
jgi:site-specific DNA-cytosine methylase